MIFEKYHVDDPPRERVFQIEKHLTIEKKDEPRFIMGDLAVKFNDEPAFLNDGLVSIIQEIPAASQKTRKKSKEINEKSKSKAVKKKSKRNNSKSNSATVESIQI